jgi:hypothetical protein
MRETRALPPVHALATINGSIAVSFIVSLSTIVSLSIIISLSTVISLSTINSLSIIAAASFGGVASGIAAPASPIDEEYSASGVCSSGADFVVDDDGQVNGFGHVVPLDANPNGRTRHIMSLDERRTSFKARSSNGIGLTANCIDATTCLASLLSIRGIWLCPDCQAASDDQVRIVTMMAVASRFVRPVASNYQQVHSRGDCGLEKITNRSR